MLDGCPGGAAGGWPAAASEALICPPPPYHHGDAVMDAQVLYDTLLVAWVLGLALLCFHLGRLVGATGWPNRR